MLLPLGNPLKCHEDVLSLQPMIPSSKRFDIFFPLFYVGCSQGLDTFRCFFRKEAYAIRMIILLRLLDGLRHCKNIQQQQQQQQVLEDTNMNSK